MMIPSSQSFLVLRGHGNDYAASSSVGVMRSNLFKTTCYAGAAQVNP